MEAQAQSSPSLSFSAMPAVAMEGVDNIVIRLLKNFLGLTAKVSYFRVTS